MTMEYRVWVRISGLSFEQEGSWGQLLRVLERDHGECGPVISWPDDHSSAVVIVAADAMSAAAASATLTAVVIEALRVCGLDSLVATPELAELAVETAATA